MAYPGSRWGPAGHPEHRAAEYIRHGTAKLLTLFHPTDGQVRVKGVTRCPNRVLPPWLKQELTDILATLPQSTTILTSEANRAVGERWVEGRSERATLPTELPPLRLLLIVDNLAGHKSADLVVWFFQQGLISLYTPLGGSWLNRAESIQRILERRALHGQHPTQPAEIIAWLESTARSWNRNPTAFVWGGKRAARRARGHDKRHRVAGSGARTCRPIRRHRTIIEKWQST